MSDRSSKRKVVGRCFVLEYGDGYIGCVNVKREEFYSTPRETYYEAMLEARKLAALLSKQRVLTECVCQCLHSSN